MEMNSFWKSFDLMLLALLISFLVVEYKSTEAETQVPSANMPAAQVSQQCHTNATSTVSVQMDTCAVLSCLHCSAKEFVMITWTIFPGDKTSCIIAYKNYNITKETNCSGTRINWKSGPERNFSLQIEPVTIHHEGYYQCDLVTPDGNFRSLYHLNVLVPPPVNLSEEENGTVVCKAAAGKPAAQISWVPKGDCFTEEKIHDNRTVTVKSTCTRNSFNASNISCFISHLTGNRTLYINHEVHSFQTSKYLFWILSVFPLCIVVGLVFYKKSSWCRKCPKPEATSGTGEDEVEPYASYTEKSNPLYDSRTEVKIFTTS
ncbi:cell surface glycoprotein CD200 receptor 1-like isoform X2 [Sminthopsis crassicaudata]|uniref:cell surface glycoprotein CD200 receptor 1-like isoform X2 n=1 Tax=Sminthopsis crassicaudata TaxID=9301 RepID=UPI003D69496A